MYVVCREDYKPLFLFRDGFFPELSLVGYRDSLVLGWLYASSGLLSVDACWEIFFERGLRFRGALASGWGGWGGSTVPSSSASADCSRCETSRLRKWSRVPWASRNSLKRNPPSSKSS